MDNQPYLTRSLQATHYFSVWIQQRAWDKLIFGAPWLTIKRKIVEIKFMLRWLSTVLRCRYRNRALV
jgi:hypothetical protein